MNESRGFLTLVISKLLYHQVQSNIHIETDTFENNLKKPRVICFYHKKIESYVTFLNVLIFYMFDWSIS